MNWQEQVNILNNLVSKFSYEYNNFNSRTNLINHLDKFNKLCDGYYITYRYNVNPSHNSTNQTNSINSTNQINSTKLNIFGDKKIKRKHLLNKIHPDKLSGTMEKIKNKLVSTNHEFVKTFNFDEEQKKISSCVIKILSDKLNIDDSFKLLKLNIDEKIFDNLCLLFGLNTNQINELKLVLDGNGNGTEPNTISSNKMSFEANFSPDIVNFVNSFNSLNLLQSPENQISQILVSIYNLINNYIKDNVFKKIYSIIENLNEFELEKKKIKIKLNETIEINKIHMKLKTNNEMDNLIDKFKELEENIKMCNEENKHYIVIANNISNKTIGNIICELANLTKKNFLLYSYFEELKNGLPYFYQFINLIKIEKITDTYYTIPFQVDNMIMDVTKLEISRVKFEI